MPFGMDFNYIYSHEGSIDNRYDNPYKKYITVTARFNADGTLIPISLDFDTDNEETTTFLIEKVFGVVKRASRKAGGAGWCYSVQIMGQRRDLYLEVDKWFVELVP